MKRPFRSGFRTGDEWRQEDFSRRRLPRVIFGSKGTLMHAHLYVEGPRDLGHLGVGFVLIGLLLIAVSIPLILQRIKMNAWYGVRIPKAFESESNWYAINRVGGRWMAGAGLVLTAIGAFVLVRPPSSPAVVILLAFAPAAIVFAVLVPIFRFANRLR